LRIALLEGGVAVGVRLYGDLVARWKKRGGPNMARLNPDNIGPGALRRVDRNLRQRSRAVRA
jgi:hypothetical protein